jgi:hypothetical protein
MTLALSWVRSIKKTRELVCVTDSRLRFGGHWDCGPKLFATPRGDSAIMFAGATLYAYPIIHHINACIAQHQKLLSRALDLQELKGHLIRVLNRTLSEISDLPKSVDSTPDVEFIFNGYDWRRRDFCSWLIHYDRSISAFTFRPTRRWTGGNSAKVLTLTGDYRNEFKLRLTRLLKERSKLTSGGFDMEPFEILRDMLREGSFERIGGPPQILNIYQHLNARPVAVFWPNSDSKRVTLGGRALLDYETHDFLTLDPDTLHVGET